MISSQLLETFGRKRLRSRFLVASVLFGMCASAIQAQEKRRGLAGRGDFEDTPAPPANAGAQPGATGPATVGKFQLKPRQLRDAVAKPDPKLTAGAPFDTKNYFFMPPDEENAGPLVLDALTDFPEAYAYFEATDSAGLEERRKNLKAAQDWLAANPNPRNWDANAIEQALGPYRTTFAKLHEAHKKPDCVIPNAISIDALLPHVQAARMIPQIAAPLIYADLARGDKAGAIDKFTDALRLGQDLQARSALITALIVSTIHRSMSESVLPILLNAKGLKEADYDKILASLKNYRSASINLLPESLKTEYLVQASLLDSLTQPGGIDKFVALTNQLKGGPAAGPNDESTKKVLAVLFTPENAQKLKLGLAKTIRQQLAAIGDIASVDDIKKIGADLDAIAKSTASEALAEVLTKETITQIASLAGGSNPALAEAAKQISSGDTKAVATKVGAQLGLNVSSGIENFVVPLLYFQNDQGIMESLTAIRRWYSSKKSVPSGKTLDEVCKEAGLEAAPLDLFSGKPMRLVWTQSGPGVLTVGHDFKDDDGKTLIARTDRGKPGATGDVVDTLALGGNPTLASQTGGAEGAGGAAPGAPAGIGQAGAQGGGIRPPGAPGGSGSGSGGRRGRADGASPVQP